MRIKNASLIEFVSPQRRLSHVLFVAYAAFLVLTAVAVQLWLPKEGLIAFSQSAGGWIHPTLLLAPVVFVPLWLFTIRWGRLTWNDFDVDVRLIFQGIIVTLVFWILMQLAQMALALKNGTTIGLHSSFAKVGVGFVLGRLISQLIVNASFEEMVFRKLAITQSMGYLSIIRQRWVRLVSVVLMTQLAFWIYHIPLVMASGVPILSFVDKSDIILVNGFLFAWIFLQTRNVWIACGFHALANAPVPLVTESVNAHGMVQRLGIVCLIVHLGYLAIMRLYLRRSTDPS